MSRLVALVVVGGVTLAMAGCATIVKGTSQVVTIDTPGAPGATCLLSSPAFGTKQLVTPASISLEKSKESVSVRCTKRCYNDGVGVIASGTEEMAAGNIIAGGLIGLGVDAASGAMNKYNPQNQITMVAIQGCRS